MQQPSAAIMKRTALIIALLVFALFAAFWTYVRSDTFALKIRPLITAPLQEVLGAGATIGRIKASLLPLYLEIRDITLPSPGSRETIAIRRIRLYLNPFPLLYGTISLPSLTVLEPRIMAGRALDGTIDLAELIAAIMAKREKQKLPGTAAYTVQLRTITIKNGKAVFSDAGTRTAITLSRMNLTLKVNLPRESYSARLASGDLTIAAPAFKEVRGKARGVVNYDQGRLILDGCELIAEDARLTTAGSVGIRTGGGLDLKITSRMGKRSIGRFTTASSSTWLASMLFVV